MKPAAPDLSPHRSLGEALRAATSKWADHLALIEADRERENCRLSYRDFADAARPIAATLQAAGFVSGDRASIMMSNQSKWLIGAYAVFYSGGVLVPLDYKLGPSEHLALLAHAKAKVLIIEYPLWRALAKEAKPEDFRPELILVTEAPQEVELSGAQRWENCRRDQAPEFVPRDRSDLACIVYSSGTGGRPKGCLLTHDNYLKQCESLMAWYPFWPGLRYLSILPTNHAIDFMVGFIGPFLCAATVIHLRTLRPEFLKAAFPRYRIHYVSVVPMVLKAMEAGLKAKFAELPPFRRWVLNRLIGINRKLTAGKPRPALSRRLLPQIHQALGGELVAFITGGAFADPKTLQFFYDLGLPVANGYGLTEAGTAVTVNDLKPFRADTVGKPLPGVEIQVLDPDADGVGEIAVRSETLMRGYLDEPELTAETFKDGWLLTGDMGRMDASGHLQLVGRLKNMVVTEGGKNIYPEDIENAFSGFEVKELCIFAANYVWKRRSLTGEQLIVVLHLEAGDSLPPEVLEELRRRNRRLPDFKRLSGYLMWPEDFPRTASLKIKRQLLADAIGARMDPEDVHSL